MIEQFNLKKAGVVNAQFGSNVTLISPTNIDGCFIGDYVFIRPFSIFRKMLLSVCVRKYNLTLLLVKWSR